jgi:alanine dehydrogenase
MDDQTFLYLNAADISAVDLDPGIAREAILDAFRAQYGHRVFSKPKLTLEIGPGHSFQTLCSAWGEAGFAANKWLGVAPVPPGSGQPGIHALIALNDFASGRLVGLLDGNVITALRTAAMSAAAAKYLASPKSRTLGLIGCGLQARFHLAAMKAILPGLTDIRAYSRTRQSAETLVAEAMQEGWNGIVCGDAENVVRNCDVIVTTVPMAAALAPFLDPAWLAPGSFVSAVDIARSWMPQNLRRLEIVATDDHRQQHESPPISPELGSTGSFDADLAELASQAKPGRTNDAERAMFIFRGVGLADLAVAAQVFAAARNLSVGQELRR